ncbi:MAG: 2-hydroxyacid dehydrogenase [Opitutaceae bacterium]|nr:2-hydroxyacid dehydrogenase [Opitutaceae bacterium]
MTKPEILLMQPLIEPIEAALDASYRVHRPDRAKDRETFLTAVAPSVRAVVTGGGLGASRQLMTRLPALEIVAVNGVGTDAVDLEYARSHSIRVTTTPDVLTEDVADLAIGLMLATSRRICAGDSFVREGRWRAGAMPLAHKVSRKRLGIVGLGRIGRAVAQRAVGFAMEISYTDLAPVAGVPYRFVAGLVQLALNTDFLVITASGGPQSASVVNKAVLDALGPKGILVNVARGSVVDEAALVAALIDGSLGGAGLDVYAREPHVPEALFRLENVVLQPHQASATVETRLAMGELVLANLAAHFAGKEPPAAVV